MALYMSGMTTRKSIAPLVSLTLLLAACSSGAPAPGPGTKTFGAEDVQSFAGIGPDEVVHFSGTEPFWGGHVSGGTLLYTTPDFQDGESVPVTRVAGRNGLSFSGDLDGKPFVLAVSPGACSDGMSDRTYPYLATLQVRGELRQGCAWTEKQPFSGPPQP
jgi:uncharacterized membrane protein